jgi:hypothetical protein
MRLKRISIALSERGPMKRKFSLSNVLAVSLIGTLGAIAGCGSSVAGSTYEGNGGVVKIEFKSGGKAYVSTGPVTTTCSYSESGKKVSMICEGDTTVFTIEDDALNGPPEGMLARLTKKK